MTQRPVASRAPHNPKHEATAEELAANLMKSRDKYRRERGEKEPAQ